MLVSQILSIIFVVASQVISEECSCDFSGANRIDASYQRRLTHDILIKPATIKGEAYNRPKASPLPKRTVSNEDISGCDSTQISVSLGDDFASISVAFASQTQGTESIVQYSSNRDYVVGNSKRVLIAYGESKSYSELLYITGRLLHPIMDEAPVSENFIIRKQDTSEWAFDKKNGEHYYNWMNVTSVIYGLGRYFNPYMIYDSPLIVCF